MVSLSFVKGYFNTRIAPRKFFRETFQFREKATKSFKRSSELISFCRDFSFTESKMEDEYENFVLENQEFGQILAGDLGLGPDLFRCLGIHMNICPEGSVYMVYMQSFSQGLLDWAKAVILDAQERFTTGTWGSTSRDALIQLDQQTKDALDQLINNQ